MNRWDLWVGYYVGLFTMGAAVLLATAFGLNVPLVVLGVAVITPFGIRLANRFDANQRAQRRPPAR